MSAHSLARSHPSRVRGLKSFAKSNASSSFKVAPFTGAWIEIHNRSAAPSFHCTSHPSRVRGLKLSLSLPPNQNIKTSHPSRVRGLKCQLPFAFRVQEEVAPFTGAWIEINCLIFTDIIASMSHPSRVRGLKSVFLPGTRYIADSRTLHGCVD